MWLSSLEDSYFILLLSLSLLHINEYEYFAIYCYFKLCVKVLVWVKGQKIQDYSSLCSLSFRSWECWCLIVLTEWMKYIFKLKMSCACMLMVRTRSQCKAQELVVLRWFCLYWLQLAHGTGGFWKVACTVHRDSEGAATSGSLTSPHCWGTSAALNA